MDDRTPGPWFAVNDGTADEPMMSVKAARIAGREPRHVVAICATGDSPQPMENANARLIAAAPDLLETLQQALPYLERVAATDNLVYLARLAIAKAKGESNG